MHLLLMCASGVAPDLALCDGDGPVWGRLQDETIAGIVLSESMVAERGGSWGSMTVVLQGKPNQGGLVVLAWACLDRITWGGLAYSGIR